MLRKFCLSFTSVFFYLLLQTLPAFAASWDSLQNPIDQTCRLSITTFTDRITAARSMSNADRAEASALLQLIEIGAANGHDDPIFLNLLHNSGFETRTKELSQKLKTYLSFYNLSDRIKVEVFHDHFLASLDPGLEHLNVFAADGLTDFLKLSKLAPVDSKGILLPGFVHSAKLLDLLNGHLQWIHLQMLYLMSEVNEVKNLWIPLLGTGRDSEARTELQLLLSAIRESATDAVKTIEQIYEVVPSTEIPASDRAAVRGARGQQNVSIMLGAIKVVAQDIEAALVVPKVQEAKKADIQNIFGPTRTQQQLQDEFKMGLRRYFSIENGVYQAFLANAEAQIALQYLIRGLMKEGNAKLRAALEGITNPVIKKAVYDGVAKASKDQDLAWVVARTHYGNSQVGYPLETAFIFNADKQTQTKVVYSSQMQLPILNFRMPQVVMARTLLRYGNFTPTSNLLEIGYGTPSILAALQPYISHGKLVGLDVMNVPEGYEHDVPGIKLFSGSAPKDVGLVNQVSSQGRYSAVFAVDVYKASVGFGAKFSPDTSNEEYLKWVYDQLEEGGVFVALNDNQTPWVFTEEQLAGAGLQRVREETYVVTGVERGLVPQNVPQAGNYQIYVYRKGTYDLSKLGRATSFKSN